MQNSRALKNFEFQTHDSLLRILYLDRRLPALVLIIAIAIRPYPLAITRKSAYLLIVLRTLQDKNTLYTVESDLQYLLNWIVERATAVSVENLDGLAQATSKRIFFSRLKQKF